MGTSSASPMPTKGNWTKLKKKASDFLDEVLDNLAVLAKEEIKELIDKAADHLLEDFHRSYAERNSEGADVPVGSVARRTSHKLAHLARKASRVGTHKALQLSHVTHFNGKREVCMDLLDSLVGTARTLEEHDVRLALEDLINELFLSAKTSNDVEQLLQKELKTHGAPGMVGKFWKLYLYHSFCRDFYERWMARASERSRTAKSKTDAYEAMQRAFKVIRERISRAVDEALQDDARRGVVLPGHRSVSNRVALSKLEIANVFESLTTDS